jgi:uncharacterized protein (TIGR00661 family)
MKILYAIQGTGNGHVARAIDLVPEFRKYGDVDVLLSGQHSELNLPFDVKYRYQGFGFFFGQNGGIDFSKTWRKNSLDRFFKEVSQLPVHEYDLVISDFEPVSAWACRIKGKTCFGMSHQSAVIDAEAPVPATGDWWGKVILKHYAPVAGNLGFHFRRLNGHISTPVIRKSIREIVPGNQGYYTVYLPAYSDLTIISILSEIRDVKWQVFSKHAEVPYSFNNISIRPVESNGFVKSMANCAGVLCNAGFETPSEALFLRKKLCVIPMKHQYEQACNAEMLKSMGVPVLQKLSSEVIPHLQNWVASSKVIIVNYPDNVHFMTEQMIEMAQSREMASQKRRIPRLAGALRF